MFVKGGAEVGGIDNINLLYLTSRHREVKSLMRKFDLFSKTSEYFVFIG